MGAPPACGQQERAAGVELYLAATDRCGWSGEQYADWLSELLRSQLLTS